MLLICESRIKSPCMDDTQLFNLLTQTMKAFVITVFVLWATFIHVQFRILVGGMERNVSPSFHPVPGFSNDQASAWSGNLVHSPLNSSWNPETCAISVHKFFGILAWNLTHNLLLKHWGRTWMWPVAQSRCYRICRFTRCMDVCMHAQTLWLVRQANCTLLLSFRLCWLYMNFL